MNERLADRLSDLQNAKMEGCWKNLQRIMPAYFFRSISEKSLLDLLPMVTDLDNKSGMQLMERDEYILACYFLSDKHNPAATSRMLEDKNILRSSTHTSKKFDGDKILVIEEFWKDCTDSTELPPTVNYEKIAEVWESKYGKAPAELSDTVSRINWRETSDLDLPRIVERIKLVMEAEKSDVTSISVDKVDRNEWRIILAAAVVARSDGWFARSISTMKRMGFQISRSYLRNFTVAGAANDFNRKAVRLNSFYVRPLRKNATNPKELEELKQELLELSWSQLDDEMERQLLDKPGFNLRRINLLRSAAEFIHSQLVFLDKNGYTMPDITRFMITYPKLLIQLCTAFEERFSPRKTGSAEQYRRRIDSVKRSIAKINSGVVDKDTRVRNTFWALTDFFSSTVKSNYFSASKSALAFRLTPLFMDNLTNRSDSYKKAFPPERPFGVFFFWRREIFGFQIRFADIARGGWRTVAPQLDNTAVDGGDLFNESRCEIFRECLVLANTQHKKNKDIYEGGSKLVTLFTRGKGDFKTELWAAQRGIFEAFLSLINYDPNGNLRDKLIVDGQNKVEIIEIGPDENMFDDMISWMGERAQLAQYTLGGGIISGKPDSGINHKHYGVTSFGVYRYLLHTLDYLGINPDNSEFTVKISGGPFGDVAGNMLKLLNQRSENGNYVIPNLKIISVTDGPAAIYDPEGIDRKELNRLVHVANLDSFTPDKLHGDGAYMICSNGNAFIRYERKHGKLLNQSIDRDTFIRERGNNIYHYADVFLPCGGRPRTIGITDCPKWFANNRPASRAIVEGANSFITPEARLELQKRGVVVVKDSSANKCGVITSSYEILSGILLTHEEFVNNRDEVVSEVMAKLQQCADREAQWLFSEFKTTGKYLTVLSDELANKINILKHDVAQELAIHPELISDNLILDHLTPVFRKKFAGKISKLSPEYRRAVTAVELALRLALQRESLLDRIRRVI